MDLRLYNSLTRRKDVFAPIDPGDVRLYVCGPTVYDRAHIGNARPLIVFDVLFRLLRHRYGADHVRYVRNITDVDDKIIVRAAERGVGIDALTETTVAGFHADAAALGCLPPTAEPRATAHIADMVAVIERLLAVGHAYEAAGHVLFDSPSMPDYGALSRRPLDEMVAGARVEVAAYKRSDTDFVLWKPAVADEPGWDSPWGRGRPGWHIECSAMSWRHLGEVFDIHGGGIDLIFPHHENELAQSRCAFGHDAMANVWMHNGFLQVEGAKMSKSAGNFVTIDELLRSDVFGGRAWPGEVLRLAMLRKHYRAPIDWTVAALEEAERTLDRWYQAVEAHAALEPSTARDDVVAALEDDLNTSKAVSVLHALFSSDRADDVEVSDSDDASREIAWDIHQREHAAVALASAHMLGLVTQDPAAWKARRTRRRGVDVARVAQVVEERLEARRVKNWAQSDRLRDELAALGVAVTDNKDGTTTWSLATEPAS